MLVSNKVKNLSPPPPTGVLQRNNFGCQLSSFLKRLPTGLCTGCVPCAGPLQLDRSWELPVRTRDFTLPRMFKASPQTQASPIWWKFHGTTETQWTPPKRNTTERISEWARSNRLHSIPTICSSKRIYKSKTEKIRANVHRTTGSYLVGLYFWRHPLLCA
jgi:hypothetical protein